MSATVHPTAHVDPTATLADGVTIGPCASVGPQSEIGPGTELLPHAAVHGWTRLGEGNRVHSFATLGGDPQDVSYRGEVVRLEVGDRNVFREGVTVSRGTFKEQGVTRVGSGCLLMACSHVGHDCAVGDGVILGNNVLLAGHVHVEARSILNGAAAVHHFTSIGRLAYVGGLSRIVMDVPPFMVVEGHPARVVKVNVVGMQRAGVPAERIRSVREAHRALWRSDQLVREKTLDRLERDEPTPEVLELVGFLRRQMAGRQGRAREAARK